MGAMGQKEAKKVLITGGTGFIGSHLAEFLIKNGYSVTCLVRDPRALRWLDGLDIDVAVGDCSQLETLTNAVKDVSIVVHAAGLTKARRSREYHEANHIGTRNMLEACSRYNPDIEKFILISSLAAAGPARDGKPVKESDLPHPISDYGRSISSESSALERDPAASDSSPSSRWQSLSIRRTTTPRSVRPSRSTSARSRVSLSSASA